MKLITELRDAPSVAQVSKPAVSQISKSASGGIFDAPKQSDAPPAWKPATQQVWKPALHPKAQHPLRRSA